MFEIKNLISLDLIWANLTDFLNQGGSILVVIMLTSFGLWLLIIERYCFFNFTQRHLNKRLISNWEQRKDKTSWCAIQIQQQLLSVFKIAGQKNLTVIKVAVVISPLLGLLGTVTGMIDVFDTMASTGSNNARGMASGVSKATIPTMAGMVISLSGLLFSVDLERKAKNALGQFEKSLQKV